MTPLMMPDVARGYVQTRVFMDTPVVIELSPRQYDEEDLSARTDRAFGWFAEVERRCSRFDEASELRALAGGSVSQSLSRRCCTTCSTLPSR